MAMLLALRCLAMGMCFAKQASLQKRILTFPTLQALTEHFHLMFSGSNLCLQVEQRISCERGALVFRFIKF